MTLKIEPGALRAYAAQLAVAVDAAETAKSYVGAQGDFSFHERGAIGLLFHGHSNYVEALDQMLGHVARLCDASSSAMNQLARDYENADLRAAADLDASYPAVPRPPLSHEAQEQNRPLPRTYGW